MKTPLINKACIIDDDKLYVSLIEILIKKHELAKEIVVFENGKLAFEYFRNELKNNKENLPEVILLDLNMPIMDGWEFLDALEPYATAIESHDLHINVVSSTINPIEVKKVSTYSIVNAFMNKPINKEAMIAAFSKNMGSN